MAGDGSDVHHGVMSRHASPQPARIRHPHAMRPLLGPIAAMAAVAACFVAGCAPLAEPGDAAAPPEAPLYAVDYVIDGDTLIIERDGRRETIRLIGIDSPETGDGRRALGCFGREARVEARRLLNGQRVRFAIDPSQDERDRYDRLLAYVWLADGTFINQAMVENGYAFEYTYDLPYRYQREFRAAEVRARETGAGLWAPEACGG